MRYCTKCHQNFIWETFNAKVSYRAPCGHAFCYQCWWKEMKQSFFRNKGGKIVVRCLRCQDIAFINPPNILSVPLQIGCEKRESLTSSFDKLTLYRTSEVELATSFENLNC